MTTERTIGVVAIVLAVIAVVIGIVGLLAPTAKAPTEEEHGPVANEIGDVEHDTDAEPTAHELELASGNGISVLSIEPSPAEPVVVPFDIVMTTNFPVAAGISEMVCTSSVPGEPDFSVSSLLALDQTVPQAINRFTIDEELLAAGGSLHGCDFTILMHGQSAGLEQHVSYDFAE